MIESDSLFAEEQIIPWKAVWQNMPEYDVQDLAPQFQVIVNFNSAYDVTEFGKLLDQPIAPSNGRQLQSVWFPKQDIGRMINKRYIEEKRGT